MFNICCNTLRTRLHNYRGRYNCHELCSLIYSIFWNNGCQKFKNLKVNVRYNVPKEISVSYHYNYLTPYFIMLFIILWFFGEILQSLAWIYVRYLMNDENGVNSREWSSMLLSISLQLFYLLNCFVFDHSALKGTENLLFC